MGELEPTRENDARIADAMGWERTPHPQGGTYWLDERGYAQTANALEYTTDEALVVPMMERLGGLLDGPIDLSPPRPARNGYSATPWRLNAWHIKRVFDATTANLAVAGALLAVWNEARP